MASFNFSDFILINLLNGYKNKSFTLEQVNIFALNYLNKGQIAQSQFEQLQNDIADYDKTLESQMEFAE